MRVIYFKRPFRCSVIEMLSGPSLTKAGVQPGGKLCELAADLDNITPDLPARINDNSFDQSNLCPHGLHEGPCANYIFKSSLFGKYPGQRTQGGSVNQTRSHSKVGNAVLFVKVKQRSGQRGRQAVMLATQPRRLGPRSRQFRRACPLFLLGSRGL